MRHNAVQIVLWEIIPQFKACKSQSNGGEREDRGRLPHSCLSWVDFYFSHVPQEKLALALSGGEVHKWT